VTEVKQFFAKKAWLGADALTSDVTVEVADGVIRRVDSGTGPTPQAQLLHGVLLPGLANTHSHVFHRALRGQTHDTSGSFWTWRDTMYSVASRLTPDSYFALAKATFREMLCAGFTTVGEFHYLHNQADGSPYDNPNAMGEAVLAAAAEAGIRITLLDTLYLHGGLDDSGFTEPNPQQRRFISPNSHLWSSRVAAHASAPNQKIGVAAHSVRAVDEDSIREVADFARDNGFVAHIHLSEQRGENSQAFTAFSKTPTDIINAAGLVGSNVTVVHGTHLTQSDIQVLGSTDTGVCFCPTTERDLADGVGPSTGLTAAGVSLSLGSDSQAVIDPFEEMRGLEMNERLMSHNRGTFGANRLMSIGSKNGYESLGWNGGTIAAGAVADFTTVSTDSVRLAGSQGLAGIVFAATSADVGTVIVAGEQVVSDA
jgi:formiminoglutamate deiminase